MKHVSYLQICILLCVLALPANTAGAVALPHLPSTNNGQRNSLSPVNTINLMTERTPLSKVMRRVLMYILEFHDVRIQSNDVILNNEQKLDDDSKKEYEGGKRGGQNEFEEMGIFTVEHTKNRDRDDIDNPADFETTKEKERELTSDSVRTQILSDEGTEYETKFAEAGNNKTNFVEVGNIETLNDLHGSKTTAKTFSDTSVLEDSLDDMFLGSTSTCDHVTGYYRHRWLRLVVKCPDHWTNETVRTRCESWDKMHGLRYIDEITMLPVQDSLGTVYGNAFCAICHSAYPIYPWTTVLQCNTPTYYSSKSMSWTNISDLNLSFLQTFHDNSFCKRTVMPSLPSSIERCENHRLWPKGIYFRSNPLDSLGMPSSFPVNFNVLMNFDFTGETHILFSAGQQVIQNEYVRRCNVGETFDTYSKQCRPVRCGSTHRLEAGKCVPIEDSMSGETMSDDFDVSALHETAKVSLSVNISFGLYLIFTEQDDLKSIVAEQIADNLNISMDRIKHINVTFEFGSIDKTGYQVQKLSLEMYKEYFPNDTDVKGFAKPASIIDTTFDDKGRMKEGRSSQRRQRRGTSDGGGVDGDAGGGGAAGGNGGDGGSGATAADAATAGNDGGGRNDDDDEGGGGVDDEEEDGDENFQILIHATNPDDLDSWSVDPKSGRGDVKLLDLILDRSRSSKNGRKEKKTKKQRLKTTWSKMVGGLVHHKVKKTAKPIINSGDETKRFGDGRIKYTSGKVNRFEKPEHPHKDTDRAKRTNELEESSISKSSNATYSQSQQSSSKKDPKSKTTPKPNQWQKIQEFSLNHAHPNASHWDTLWSLLQPLGIKGEIPTNQTTIPDDIPGKPTVNSNVTDLFNTENKIYLSPPLNEENDRMLLGTDSEINFDQPMAMRISFILVPSDDPGSDEEQAMALLKKIGDLITDREFTLLVSGNEVTVVNSDDPEEDEEKANQFCPWGVMFIVYDDEFSILEIDNITMLYVNKTKTYHGIGRFDLWVMVKGKNSAYETSVTNLKEYAFVCFMPRILQRDCQRITLTPDEYQVVSANNRSIMFEENEYNITTYSVLNETSGEIQICVPQSYDPNKGQLFPHYFSTSKGCGSEFDNVRQAEGYLTLILGRVSIAAQALVLLTYFLFPSLRNLPGCNIMNLTLALFIAETIFEEGMLATTQWRCVTVAITLHFFFLASHFWMNVMSFDVFRAFSSPNVSTSSKTDKQTYFPKYFLYAWGMPAVIVSICSFIEFSDLFKNTVIGYGGTEMKNRNSNITFIYSNFLFGDQQNVIQDVNIIEEDVVNQRAPTNNITFTNSLVKESQTACWIQNPLASLLTFGAPILLIFILNCVFFVRTIINISRTVKLTNESLYRQHSQHSNSSYNKTSGRSEAMLYLRMSTVMGFTWVFGFSSAIISSVADQITPTICVVVHIHSILFVIFNISQGLFIFVAFLCNRRVLRLYAGLFFRLKRFVRRQSYKSKIYSITSSTNSTLSSSTKTSSISSRISR